MTDELPLAVAVSLVLTGVLLAGWGTVLAVRTTSRTAGALLVLAAAGGGAAVALDAAGHGHWPVLAAAGTALALAVMAYPRVRPDVPSGVAAAVLLVAPGLLWVSGAVVDSSALAVVIAAVPLLHLWWRVEESSRAERRAITWVLAAAVAVCFAGFVVGMVEPPAPVVAVYLPLLSLVGAAAWVGTTRPGAIDVRGVVAGLAVNTLAALAVFTVFRLASVALEALGADQAAAPTGALLAAATAFLLPPVRHQLRLVADEILFGVRPDPLVAAGRVALGVGDDAQTALDTVRTALVLPFAELRIGGLPVITSGTPSEHLHAVPLHADGHQVGDLVVGLRPGDLHPRPEDVTVLSLAAPLLAQTVRARALAEGLQEARAATSYAREEERRRLRRDLHDGLGPRLSGIAFTADAALLAAGDPDDLALHLRRVRTEAVQAIREIRELVQGLRPPALDELGLTEAVRLQSTGLRGEGGRPLDVTVTGSVARDLPAAVEVAAYRITVEALTNVARHSGAHHATASLEVADGALHVVVRDDGMETTPWVPGIGLTSMTERAHELGGSITAGAGEVRAVLPL